MICDIVARIDFRKLLNKVACQKCTEKRDNNNSIIKRVRERNTTKGSPS